MTSPSTIAYCTTHKLARLLWCCCQKYLCVMSSCYPWFCKRIHYQPTPFPSQTDQEGHIGRWFEGYHPHETHPVEATPTSANFTQITTAISRRKLLPRSKPTSRCWPCPSPVRSKRDMPTAQCDLFLSSGQFLMVCR